MSYRRIKSRYFGLLSTRPGAPSKKYADIGRLRLAKAVLAGLRAGITDAEVLNKHALASMRGQSPRKTA